MVRSASSVTSTRQCPLTTSPGTAGVGVGSKATPTERMSWVKAMPSPSSATRPRKAARPPSAATPAAVLAADPPEASVVAPIRS